MREKAVVISNRGNEAKVEIIRSSACDHCQGCDVGTKKKTIEVWAKNPIKAKVGQTVEIELEAATMLTATFITYVIPLFAFIMGIGLGYKGAMIMAIALEEIFALFTGLIMMGFSFYGVHLYSNSASKSQKYNSSIVNIL